VSDLRGGDVQDFRRKGFDAERRFRERIESGRCADCGWRNGKGDHECGITRTEALADTASLTGETPVLPSDLEQDF
jgi:hypothetical protein